MNWSRGFRHFVTGFFDGLSAPGRFLSSALDPEPLKMRRTTLDDSWRRTGDYLRSAMGQFGSAPSSAPKPTRVPRRSSR